MIPVKFIDYQKCHEYARTLGGQYGIPRCEWDDLGSDAFLLAIKRARRSGNCKNIEAAANRLMYTSVLNAINRRNTKANKMISRAEEISSVFFDTSKDPIVVHLKFNDPPWDCLHWEVVDRTPATEAETAEDWQNPLWLRLFKYQRSKLKGILKIIVKLLMKDSRLPLARAAIGISRPTFLKNIQKLRKHFDQCFRALQAWHRRF